MRPWSLEQQRPDCFRDMGQRSPRRRNEDRLPGRSSPTVKSGVCQVRRKMVKGFGRRPLAGRSCVVRGRRSKASQGGNRGEEGTPVWSGATYGDFRIADGSRVSPRGPVARNLGGGNDDDERVRSRGCAGLAWARRSGEDWRPREDVGFLLRRAGMVKGFGRRPLVGRSCELWGRRSKASQGGNRGDVGALFGRARPMEILGSRTARVCRRGGRWRAISAAETMMTSEFGREDARPWRGRSGRGRTDDLERTSASCSGARVGRRR